jgi:hypothetical protein
LSNFKQVVDVRRVLTKGQQAMAMAMRYPEPNRRGKKRSVVSQDFSETRLSQARSVLHHSRSLAESVLKGITPLDAALTTMKQQEQYQQSDEAKTFATRRVPSRSMQHKP